MTEVRVAVEREADTAICCPRCVALNRYDDAPNLAATVGEHALPTTAIREPRPAAETVRALGRYCDDHDVFLPIPYSTATDCDDLFDEENWIAVPIHTKTGRPLAVPVRLAEMLGESP